MRFLEALKSMKEGKKIKLPSWGGYWYWDNKKNTIMMHCKEGRVLDIRETEQVEYTLTNVVSDEWILATEKNTPVLGGEATFNFGEAIKYLKRGLKVSRQGWNGKGMYLILLKPQILIAENKDSGKVTEKEFLVPGDKELPILPAIYIKTADDKLVPWVTSQMDVLAEDYIFADIEQDLIKGK